MQWGRKSKKGSSTVEVTISLVILAFALFGLGSTTARLTRVAVGAELRSLALQAVEDRVFRIRLHPDYQHLDSLFSESESEVPEFPGYHRSTVLRRVREPGKIPDRYLDYTSITVTVDGPGLARPISRTVTIGVS
jgi:hypothetical protein